MVVGELAEPVDLLVVGGGPGGYVAAVRAAELGRSVVVVDRGPPEGGLGGACLHVGCIPSKALIELANAYSRTHELAATGLTAAGVTVDLATFQVSKTSLIARLSAGVSSQLREHRIRCVDGTLRFNRPNRAAVVLANGENQFFEFEQAIVATGSRPTQLLTLVADGEQVMTSTQVLALDALPSSLAVIGAGYIGLEIGTALAKLGTRVSMIEACDRILPAVDEKLTKPVERRLTTLGVTLHTSSKALRVEGDRLVYESAEGEGVVPAEKVLVAVGRTANTDDVGLASAGVTVDADGLIHVDERMLATKHIAAIGDVVAGPAFAHKASAEAIVAAEALSGLPTAFEPAAIPAIIFSDPEIATVGLTEAQAARAGFDVVAATSVLGQLGRAATLGAHDGFTNVVADRSGDRVLGVHIVGPHASELIGQATLAIEMGASRDDILGTIAPHPTLSEGLRLAFERLRSDTFPSNSPR